MASLEGKTALVTGAGSGIGRATASLLAQRGATVVACDINPAGIEELAKEMETQGHKVVALRADVGDADGVARMIDQARTQTGDIDVIVNNAGIVGGEAKLNEIAIEEWDRMLRIHLWGTVHCTRLVTDGMIERRWGRVVNMSSVAAVGSTEGTNAPTHYSAAKAAIIGFTKSLARELAPHGVTANCIAPGPVRTPMLNKLSPSKIETIIKNSPMKRLGEPEDIAYVAAFLSSDEASFITGQVISPNGGMYI